MFVHFFIFPTKNKGNISRYLECKMILNILLSEMWHNSLPEVNMNIKKRKIKNSQIINSYLSDILQRK